MKDSASSNRTKLFLTLTLMSLVAFIPILVGINIYINATSDEIIYSWYDSEKTNIQQGNILSSITKLQRSITKSVILKAVKVTDNNGRELIDFKSKTGDVEWPTIKIKETSSTIHREKINFYKNIYTFSTDNISVFILTGSMLSLYVLSGITIYFLFIILIFSFIIRRQTIMEEKLKSAIKLNKMALDLELSEKITLIATQVSHDIRSPLASLNMMIEQLENIPDNYRMIIRHSAQRINDIANNLLTSNQNISSVALIKNEFITPIISSLISEKRMQYRNKPNINIVFALTQYYGLFAKINSSEFKRILSNLINNSVESLVNNIGEITISIQEFESNISISIADTGKGIPLDILEKLGTKGVTFGKNNSSAGSGLGIYHAKVTLETFGGSINVTSTVGKGTTLKLTLPKEIKPSWFVEKISLHTNSKIIILDDDLSIHHIWIEKFKKLQSDSDITIHSFTEGADFILFIKSQSDLNFICLIDYELAGQEFTGLDIIEINKIANNSILVTSRYEENLIRERAHRLNLKIIPKEIARLVPIEFQQNMDNDYFEYVYIEDDKLLRVTWEILAKKNNIKLLSISNTGDFIKNKDCISKDKSLIYIDSNLGIYDLKGEIFANILHEEGYKNIFMASGFDADHFAQLPWFNYAGKICPFK
ncbi:MAG: HAMP domain-containing sensor histidine kinase [Bacteriovorax sp.]|nr:HAMP domain-containing sensor histidine kinase [Bacteriovorax sp.]